MKNIMVVVGPTGVGKTKLSVDLAKEFNAQIINADSMQVYKHLNIGTAKVTEEEKEGVIHHLFDIVNPNENYSIYEYQKDARLKIKELQDKNIPIILVGGSALYIRALLYDYKFEEEKYVDTNINIKDMYKYILSINKDYNEHINNEIRIKREYIRLKNNINKEQTNKKMYNFIMIGLTKDRKDLYSIINNRVDIMVKDGLFEEVKHLVNNNLIDQNIITGIGYKEIFKYINNEITKEESIDLIKRNSRRYAKRQYTFFNNKFDVNWFDTTHYEEAYEQIKDYIKKKETK